VATNDAELLERWTTGGDAQAFDSLVTGYSGLVYSACRRVLGNDADAQDATQECFLQLAQRTPKIQTSLAAWLHTVATRKAISRVREETRRTNREQSYATEVDTTVEAEWDDIQAYIDEAIRALPEENRVPVVASFLERKTHAVIAREIGVDRSTISRRIDRGIEGIRDFLKEKGVLATSASLLTMLTTKMTEAMPVGLTGSLAKIALTGGRLQTAGGEFLGGMTFGKAVAGAIVFAALLAAFWFMNPLNSSKETVVALSPEASRASEVQMEATADREPSVPNESDAASGTMAEGIESDKIAQSPQPPSPSITGRLYDASNNNGLEGIELLAFSGEESDFVAAQVTTEQDGYYAMSELGAGSYRIVTPELDGFFETYGEGKTVHVEIPESLDAAVKGDIELNRGGVLTGVAIFGANPLRNTEIDLSATITSGTSPPMLIAHTDSSGRFRIEDLPAFKGQVIPRIEAENGLTQDAIVVPLVVELNEVSEITLNFRVGTAAIEGTVYYENESMPIQAQIEINFVFEDEVDPEDVPKADIIRVKTDENGHYIADGLPEGYAEMQVFTRIEGQIVDGRLVEQPVAAGPVLNLVETVPLSEGTRVTKDFIFTSLVLQGEIRNIPTGTQMVYLLAHPGERAIEMTDHESYLELRDTMVAYDQLAPSDLASITGALRGLAPGRYTITAAAWPTWYNAAAVQAYGIEKFFENQHNVSTFITVGESDQRIDVVLDFAAP